MHAHGCEEVQGYLLSRPLPADALEALLADPGGLLEPASHTGGLSDAEVDFMGVVAEASRPVEASRDPVRPVLAELRRVTGADAVYLTRVNWDDLTQEVAFSASAASAVPEGLRFGWPGSPCDSMLRGGPRLVDDLASAAPHHPLVGTAGLATLATVPLRTPDGEVLGTLCAAHRDRGALGPGTVVLLELFAALLIEHVGAVGQRGAAALT